MKACRVIKIIAFVLALLFTAVAIAGNVMIIRESCISYVSADSDTKVSVSTIIKDLEERNLQILPSNKASAEGETTAEPEDSIETTETTESETATEGETQDDAIATPEATDEPEVESAANEDVKRVYNLDNHHYLIVSLMKAGSARIDKLPLLEKLNGVSVFGFTLPQELTYSSNLCATVAFGLLFLAFLLHCISKDVSKTFYGILLMILGYLMFVVFVFAGLVIGNAVYYVASTTFDEVYDAYVLQTYFTAALIAVGVLFGLPYLRCGSRQMRMKELKAEVKRFKKQRRKNPV